MCVRECTRGVPVCACLYVYFHNKTSYIQYIHYKLVEFLIKAMMILFVLKTTRKAPRVGANSSSVFAFDMHYK